MFYVSCTDIDNNKLLTNSKLNDSSCVNMYSSVDKIKFFNITQLCVECKHDRYEMIGLPNFDDKLSFKKMNLNVNLQMSYKITKKYKQKTLKQIEVFLSKLNDICPECIDNNIINNSPKPYPSSTRIIKLNIQKYTLWMGDLKLPCYITIQTTVIFVERFVLIVMTIF